MFKPLTMLERIELWLWLARHFEVVPMARPPGALLELAKRARGKESRDWISGRFGTVVLTESDEVYVGHRTGWKPVWKA